MSTVTPLVVSSTEGPASLPRSTIPMIEHRFSPYDNNGGTVAAVAGTNYVVIAADTRLSSGYEILSRDCSKQHALTSHCVLASSGCKTDVDQLRSVLDIKMKVSWKLYFWVLFCERRCGCEGLSLFL